MKVIRLVFAIIIGFFLVTACSPQNYLDARAKAIKRADNQPETQREECDKYLEYYQDGDRIDSLAVEKCLGALHPNNSPDLLKFCKIFYDSRAEITPAIYDTCLQAAKKDSFPTTDFDFSRERFRNIVKTIPFLHPEDVQAYENEISTKEYVVEAQKVLWKIPSANEECENASATVSKFWDYVTRMKLETAIEEDVKQVILSSAKSIDGWIAEGNYACTEDIFDNLATLINASPTPDAYSKEIETKLQEWHEAGQKLPSVGKNLDAIVLLGGVQKISQTPELVNEIEMTVSGVVEKEALLVREPIRVFELAGYLCQPREAMENMIYLDVMDQVIFSDQGSKGKFLNCTDADLPDEQLATSLSEIKYLVQVTPQNRKIEKTCEYSGGHTLDLYTVDYLVTVKDIDSNEIVAETVVNSDPTHECSLFMTFISKRDGYDLPPSGEEISTWLSTLALD